MLKIESIKQLKKESIDGANFALMLNPVLRSSKHVRYDPRTDNFRIHNLIDNTYQCVSSGKLSEETLIPDAINAGRFFKD